MDTFNNISVVAMIIIIIILAIMILLNNHICDFHSCQLFKDAFHYPSLKKQLIYILDCLCEDGLWSFGLITSGIVAGLYFCILPIELNIYNYLIVFILTLLVFYYIMSFYISIYVKPIKNYIIDYINSNMD